MPKGVATEKVHGGKLVRVKVDYAQSLNDVQITGDFFLHPEESIAEIEKAIRGADSSITRDEIAARIRDVVASRGIILVGVTEDAIAKLVKEAMSN